MSTTPPTPHDSPSPAARPEPAAGPATASRKKSSATRATPSGSEPERLPLRMLHDRLLVLPEVDSSERQSSAGLVIPATAVGPKRLAWAQVVATGENVRHVSRGDRVLFDPEERAEVELNGKSFVLLREKDVSAVSQPEETSGKTGLYL
ncbi:co-chaperone GroES [Oerskovia paurometabola]|uniref:GroES family chaperonin n=1 Tax=Oerskovia paurometabola TaxID=162170 RepID=UPI003F4DA82D